VVPMNVTPAAPTQAWAVQREIDKRLELECADSSSEVGVVSTWPSRPRTGISEMLDG
jgi:hypothetical protein